MHLEQVQRLNSIIMSITEISEIFNFNSPTRIFITCFHTASFILEQRKAFPIDIVINTSNVPHDRKTVDSWANEGIDSHYFFIYDHKDEDIICCAEKVYQIIERAGERNVLIHCHAGISRSVSCVIYYLIKKHKMTFEQALELVQASREVADPNEGFEDQLQTFADQCK